MRVLAALIAAALASGSVRLQNIHPKGDCENVAGSEEFPTFGSAAYTRQLSQVEDGPRMKLRHIAGDALPETAVDTTHLTKGSTTLLKDPVQFYSPSTVAVYKSRDDGRVKAVMADVGGNQASRVRPPITLTASLQATTVVEHSTRNIGRVIMHGCDRVVYDSGRLSSEMGINPDGLVPCKPSRILQVDLGGRSPQTRILWDEYKPTRKSDLRLMEVPEPCESTFRLTHPCLVDPSFGRLL